MEMEGDFTTPRVPGGNEESETCEGPIRVKEIVN